MVHQKYIAFLITMLLFAQISRAQETANKFEAGFNYHYGFLWGHRASIKVLTKGYANMMELSFYKKFTGENDWELKYKYPSLGGSFFYFDFGNPEQLGYGYSVLAFFDFPLVGNEKAALSFKIGTGPGFVSKHFDRKDNLKHWGLSTTVNGFAHLSLKGKFKITDHLNAAAGISLSHFSNASFKKPNLGINLPGVTAGLFYAFKPVELTPRKLKSEYSYAKNWNHDLVLNYGAKEKNPIGGSRHSVFSLNYSGSRHISFKSRLGAGLDFFYNTAHKNEPDANDEIITSPSDILQMGISAAYTLQISKFSIFFSPGIYYYTAYVDDGNFYTRMGIRYLVKDHLLLNISMKTHYAVADHSEFGIGYRF